MSDSELKLKIQIRELQKKYFIEKQLNQQKTEECEQLKASLKNIFTKGQLQKLQAPKQKVLWKLDDIASAIRLYTAGPKCYRYMYKNGYPLPSVSALKRWSRKIEISPGVLKSVLRLMKFHQEDKSKHLENVCILSFDEMSIKSSYEYDQISDAIITPSKNVQVVMARGLFAAWKQPVYYNFDCKMTISILNQIIKALKKVNYNVVAIVSDMATSNQKLWDDLMIGINKTWFRNPTDSTKKIYVFADAPHLLKLIRNHFLDDGYIVNGKLITVAPIKEAFYKFGSDDLKIMHKISSKHFDVAGPERQKVKLAAQLLSHTVSASLRRFYQLGKLSSPNVMECANFVKSINDWFDVFNSKIAAVDSRERMKAYGLALETQNQILSDIDQLIFKLRTPNKSCLLPFQKGILINNTSLRSLFEDMQKTYGTDYILTHRLNQDVLENMFSVIRAKGGLHDHPTATEFSYRLRSYILGNTYVIISI